MDYDKSGRRQTVDLLMHSSIDIDQMIVFEADIIEDSIEQGKGNSQAIELSLLNIRSYAEENSRRVRAACNLVRDMD